MMEKIGAHRWPLAIAFVALPILATAGRVLPSPSTIRVGPDGRIETWSRTHRLLPIKEWWVGRSSRSICGSNSLDIDHWKLGFFEVTDTRASRRP